MHDPNDVPNGISGVQDDASMEMKPLPTNVPHSAQNPQFPVTRFA